jgi:uncharacterized protein (DUF1778 family)
LGAKRASSGACRTVEGRRFDQTRIVLSPTEWKRIATALDGPPRPPAALRRLMARRAPWER